MTSGLAGHNGTTTALTYMVQAERLNRAYKKRPLHDSGAEVFIFLNDKSPIHPSHTSTRFILRRRIFSASSPVIAEPITSC